MNCPTYELQSTFFFYFGYDTGVFEVGFMKVAMNFYCDLSKAGLVADGGLFVGLLESAEGRICYSLPRGADFRICLKML